MTSQLLRALFGDSDLTPEAIELRARNRKDDTTPVARRWATRVSNVQAFADEYDAKGYDVYFGVAQRRKVIDPKTGKRVGTKEAFSHSNAAWIDLDKSEPPQTLLTPSAAIISGRGFHIYWFFEAPVEDPVKLEEINRGLALLTGADKGCADCVHILRVPGTHNYKTPKRRAVVESFVHPERVYDPDDLLALTKLSKATVEQVTTEDFQGDRSRRDWGVVCNLVRSGMSDEAIGQIFSDWPVGDKMREVGSQYLEHTIMRAREKIEAEGDDNQPAFTIRIKGSPSSNPTGGSAEADGTPSPAEERERRRKKSKRRQTESGEEPGSDSAELAGLEVYPDLRLAEGPGGLYALDRKLEHAELIASFRLDVEGMVQADDSLEGKGHEPDEYVLQVVANGNTWRHVVLPVSAFDDDRKLRKYLNRAAWSFWGSASQANALRQVLILKWNKAGKPRKVVVRQLGRQLLKSGKTTYDVIATSDGVYDAQTGEPVTNLVYLKPDLNLPTVSLDFSTPVELSSLRSAAEALVRVHTREVTVPMLAWWVACTYKAPLMALDVHFPHFLVHGTRGSGKSTLLRMFQQLQGIEPTSGDQLSSGTTPFVISRTLGASMSTPIRLTEFRSDTVRDIQRFYQILRQLYDGGVDARGRADQSTVAYVYTAPLCLDGEEPLVDPALKERTIMTYLSTDVLENNPDFQQVRRDMPSLPVAKLGAQLMLYAAGQDIAELYAEATQLVQQAFTNLPLRVENNVAILTMGLLTYARFCREKFGSCVLRPDQAEELRTYLTPCIAQTVDVDTGFSRLPADDFIEAVLNHIASLQSQGELARPEFQYRVEEQDGGLVGIHLASAYAWWAREALRSHRGQPIERNTIRRMLQNERMLTASERIGRYVLNITQAACSNTKVVQRLYMVDPSRAALAGLDVPSELAPAAEAYFEMKEGKVKLGFGD